MFNNDKRPGKGVSDKEKKSLAGYNPLVDVQEAG
jgi:hypothetical protein